MTQAPPAACLVKRLALAALILVAAPSAASPGPGLSWVAKGALGRTELRRYPLSRLGNPSVGPLAWSLSVPASACAATTWCDKPRGAAQCVWKPALACSWKFPAAADEDFLYEKRLCSPSGTCGPWLLEPQIVCGGAGTGCPSFFPCAGCSP